MGKSAHMQKEIAEAMTSKEKVQELSPALKEYIYLLEQYKNVVDESNIVSKTNPKGIITYVNRKFEEISGYSSHELLGKNHNIIRHADMPASAFKNMWDTIEAKKNWHGIVKNRKKDGGHYIVEATIIPILDSNSEITEYIAIRKDITRLIEQNRRIRRQTTDTLTSLPNYNRLAEDAEKAKGKTLILMNIDLFREIVDFYGEEIANDVLVEVGNRLKKIKEKLASRYTLYKLYGDEYAFFWPEVSPIEDLEKVIERIHLEVNQDSVVLSDDLEIHFSISMGAYTGTEKYSVNKSKIALKYARESKRVMYIYDEMLQVQHRGNLESVRLLKQAIATNKIIPYYQPIVNNDTGAIEKYESLVRIVDQEDQTLLPISFLQAAKKSKLYPFLTMSVIEHVLELAAKKDYEFSINLSVEDVMDDKIKFMIIEALKAYRAGCSRIIFEITESENIESFQEVKDFISAVREYGCKIAIDDFGSGYSNFEYLAQLDVDYIKIDGSLIKNIHKDPTLRIIVKAIVDFAQQMGFKTVAEYIHCREVYEVIHKMGIDYSQGYYFGTPVRKIE